MFRFGVLYFACIPETSEYHVPESRKKWWRQHSENQGRFMKRGVEGKSIMQIHWREILIKDKNSVNWDDYWSIFIESLTEVLYGHSLNFLTVVGNTDINQTFKKFTLHSVKKVRNYSQMKNVSSSLFTLWLINGKVDFTKFLGKHDESKIVQFSHCALWKQ